LIAPVSSHRRPFHSSASGRVTPCGVSQLPTAVQCAVELHDAAQKALSRDPAGSAVRSTDQLRPSHRSANDALIPDRRTVVPTAIHDDADTQVPPYT
jgi:hypothetical protein